MSEPDFKGLRVLVVGGKAANIQVLRTAFGLIGIRHIFAAGDSGSGIDALRHQSFGAIFCDATVDRVDRMPFHVAARRAPGIRNPMTPLFMIYSQARRRHVEHARDSGVTDVLTHPVSAATIARKLTGAIKAPRKFIAAPTFFGPDRRTERGNSWYGDDRRKRIPRKTRVVIPDADDLAII